MTEPKIPENDWERLYDWFHQNVEELKEQVDRLAADVKELAPATAEGKKAFEAISGAAASISAEAERAGAAWNQAEVVAQKIGREAGKAAHTKATSAIDEAIEKFNKVNQATVNFHAELERQVDNFRFRLSTYFAALLIGMLLAAAGGIAGGFALANRAVEPLRSEREQLIGYGVILKAMFENSEANERKVLDRLWKKVLPK